MRLFDFYCDQCDVVWEELVDKDTITDVCAYCGGYGHRMLSSPNIAGFSLKDADAQRESLLKRSYEHTQKQVAKEPEKFGRAGIERVMKK